MRKSLTLFILSLLLSTAIKAQTAAASANGKPFVLAVTEQLWSKQLSEERLLNIYLPDDYYKDTTKKFPVIYLLDGSANEDFIHIVGVVQFLTMIGAMPQTIVVGIANIDRKRDFTFPTTIEKDKKDFPTTGGSEKFISFLEKDLEPYIEGRYRTGTRTIIGQSLGGLVATEILLRKPALFDKYIIVSPSLWWDNESLLAKAPALMQQHSYSHTIVDISVGAEGKQMEGDAHQLENILEQHTNPVRVVIFNYMPKENHLTILHNSVYEALMKLNEKQGGN